MECLLVCVFLFSVTDIIFYSCGNLKVEVGAPAPINFFRCRRLCCQKIEKVTTFYTYLWFLIIEKLKKNIIKNFIMPSYSLQDIGDDAST